MIMPLFAAERTISGEYTLTTNEDWTGDSVTLERGATVDLAGHNLAVGVVALGSGSGTATFTDSSAGTGELRFTIPIGATFTKTADIAITGNLALVKDGAGLFSWNGGTLAADIPIIISGGTFKLGVTTANVFGSSGTITVNGTGQFDLNYTGSGGGSSPVLKRTFYIEGDGPDGFGAIVNNATLNRYGKHLEHVFLTGDATIGGKSRIDFRGDGCGIDGTGYTLTIKNTSDVTLAEGTTHLNCARLVIADNGVFNPCSYYVSQTKKYCVLTIPDGIILENGGKFVSWAHDSNHTPNYSTPIFVREGSGTISSSKKYYTLSGAITVQTGTTLNCTTTIGPGWYSGAITNETDATLNISGESSVCGGIFRNDGTVNHTAAKFVLGHRDNANSPCAVENNGIIRTSGGTFIFKAESSMTGTGTLELAGGSPSVAGKLSGFTGTIRVSGATATINNIATFPGTLVLANGKVSTSLSGVTCPVVFDLSGKTAPFTIPESWLTLPENKQVTIDLRGRTMVLGEKLLSWESAPSLKFLLAEGSTPLVEKEDGLYFGDGDIVPVSATWTGEANNGLFSDVANWTCLDENNDPVSAFPVASTVITLGADVPQGGWATFDLANQTGMIDLNGHRVVLYPASGNSPALAITDTSLDTSHPGELRFFIGEGVTYTKTESFGITGNLSLVKDGPGLFVWGGGTLDKAIPITVSDGIFKLGVTTVNVFGSSGMITVNGTGQFDLNYSVSGGSSPVLKKTFYIEGDGPDGSGAIVNNAASNLYGKHLEHVVMTDDATIGGKSRIDFRGDGCGIDGTDYTLTIKNTSDVTLADGTTHLNCARLVIADNGVFNPCSYYASKTKKYCVLTIPDGIILENGGKFASWAHGSNNTPEYSTPIFVREGSGTIRSSNKYYKLSGAITVQTGTTLNCTTQGPWYNGAITNETDATINIGGDFFAIGGIFRNDGSVVHTAGNFYFGSRDDQTHPCRVENNGVFRTVGGNFYFRSENHAHGAGTFDLAGSTATLAGDFSDFTGTILLSGGTATISSINTFTGTLRLKGGTISTSLAAFTGTVVIDVSDIDAPLNVDGKNWFTLPAGTEVLIDAGDRELQLGDKLLSWTTPPSGIRFRLLGDRAYGLRRNSDGIEYNKPRGMRVIVR